MGFVVMLLENERIIEAKNRCRERWEWVRSDYATDRCCDDTAQGMFAASYPESLS